MEVSIFAQNVKKLRENKGYKQADMLTAIGFPRSTWNNYETGKSKPSFDDLIKISEYFGVSESDLLHTEITDAHLIALKQGGKKLDDAHLNAHANAPLKGPYTDKKTNNPVLRQ